MKSPKKMRRSTQMAWLVALSITTSFPACSGDDAVSRFKCTNSLECPRPYFCNYGQCQPLDAVDADSDNVPEETEIILGLDPFNADSDGDGRVDGNELDFDSDAREYTPRDRDGDGVIDALESDVNDADGDGYPDEVDPCNDDPNCPAEGGRANDCANRLGEVCVYGQGACEVLGTIQCAGSGRDPVCVGEEIAPNQEQCDGIDNDCDGRSDEDFGNVGSVCTPGVGQCRASGIIRCDSMTSASCDVEASDPSSETCDGGDNDCDGRIDEDFELGLPCDSGDQDCIRPGIVECEPTTQEARCIPLVIDDVPESCDGEDNDCDGLIDEDFASIGTPCEAGDGDCTLVGVLVCDLEGTALICSVESAEPTIERCNEQDDDCDGRVDEAFIDKAEACTVGLGVCAVSGQYTCNDVGDALECVPNSMPTVTSQPERCDQLDNDCDGQVDETFPDLGEACTTGIGACARPGRVICDSVSGLSRCDARAGFSSIEQCNGVDDDCDGQTDESFPGVGAECELTEGSCTFTGFVQCDAQGSLVCQRQAAIQGDEICDGLDNDCDMLVDEGLGVGEACELDANECNRQGTLACGNDGSVYCSASPLPMVSERCDGEDNDCDGRIDETFVNLGQLCDTERGACRGSGTYQCADSQLTTVCDAIPVAEPADELCDGIDNDCDGRTDETFPTLNTVCFEGEYSCAVEGRRVCTEAGDDVRCNAIPRAPGPELCNDLDDDCNGLIDDPFSDKNEPCETGLGECSSEGILRCAPDGASLDCQATQTIQPTTEQCDDLDNDCDGQVDEDYGPGCRLLVDKSSAAGFHTCVLDPAGQVRCFGDVANVPETNEAQTLNGAGDDHCLVDIMGLITCWGSTEALSPPLDGLFTHVSVGRSGDACALDQNETAQCWGTTPSLMPAPQDRLSAIAVGDAWACGIRRDDGTLRCWGEVPLDTPTPVQAGFKSLAMGGSAACALTSEDLLQCWGRDSYGVLTPTTNQYSQFDIGPNSGCALTAAGEPE
ncbi:MAG: RCC1 domain-containing protein, partial [Bradymonadia bacterium]